MDTSKTQKTRPSLNSARVRCVLIPPVRPLPAAGFLGSQASSLPSVCPFSPLPVGSKARPDTQAQSRLRCHMRALSREDQLFIKLASSKSLDNTGRIRC